MCMNKYVFLPSDVCIFLNFFFTIITSCRHIIGIQSVLKRHSRRLECFNTSCLLPATKAGDLFFFFLIKTFIDLPI